MLVSLVPKFIHGLFTIWQTPYFLDIVYIMCYTNNMRIKYYDDNVGGYFIIYDIIPDQINIIQPDGSETVIVISYIKSIDYGDLYGNPWLCNIKNMNLSGRSYIRMVKR